MKYNYYIADVFTTQLFSGAQIAVFPHAQGLDQGQMQLIARELNLSETAFVFPSSNGNSSKRARIYTPQNEVNFAGHPIIAIGKVLAKIGEIKLENQHTKFILEQNIGTIEVNITQQNGEPSLIQYTLQTKPEIDRFTPDEEQLAEILSVEKNDIETKKYHSLIVFADQSYLIIPIRSFNAVRNAKFNFDTWSRSGAPASMFNELLLFSTQTDLKESNFHARLIGPKIGINQDPPIGSAMLAFAAYLRAHDHIRYGTHTFVVDRGNIYTRKSILSVEMDKKDESTLTIRVGGPAVIAGQGSINL